MTAKKTHRFAAFAAAALVLSGASLALAAPGGKAGAGKGGKGQMFQRADKNKDGFLTAAEVGAKRWTRISKADSNKDSKVSQAELQAAHKAGTLSRGKGHRKGRMFQLADKNQDGFLTAAEVGAKRWTRISKADANNDAKVSQAELQAARKAGKLGHKGKGKGKGKKS